MMAIKSVAGMALACVLLAPSMQTGTVSARAQGAILGGTPQTWRAARWDGRRPGRKGTAWVGGPVPARASTRWS